MMTNEPARLCGLDHHGLGSLREGGTADITVIDPNLEWTFTADGSQSRSVNSPFLGRTLRGRAVMTMIGGVIRHQLPATLTTG